MKILKELDFELLKNEIDHIQECILVDAVWIIIKENIEINITKYLYIKSIYANCKTRITYTLNHTG